MILHKYIIYSLSNNFKIFASWWFCNFLWLKSRLYWLKMEWTLKMRIWFEISVIFSCQHKPLRYWCFSLVDTHSIENCAYLIIYQTVQLQVEPYTKSNFYLRKWGVLSLYPVIILRNFLNLSKHFYVRFDVCNITRYKQVQYLDK